MIQLFDKFSEEAERLLRKSFYILLGGIVFLNIFSVVYLVISFNRGYKSHLCIHDKTYSENIKKS